MKKIKKNSIFNIVGNYAKNKKGVDIMEEPKKEETTQVPESQPKGMISTVENKNFNQVQDNITITPTMIDTTVEKAEKSRDISAIIPKTNDTLSGDENTVALTSREKELKGDGSTILATVDQEIEVTMSQSPVLPEQIDIEERKEEQKRNKNTKRVVKKKKSFKREHQIQNIGSIIAIIAILIIAGAVYYYYNHPTENDFQVLTVTVEVGDELPIRASSYVKPGIGKTVDELLYKIDKSEVRIDKVGEYPYTVTYNGITKKGKIIIQDTTPPKVKVRETVTIKEGDEYTPETFIISCDEQEGCNYSFQDKDQTKKCNTAGICQIFVVATDAYGNSTTMKVSLVIEDQSDVKTYVKHTTFDFNSGYEMDESYELHFSQYTSYKLLSSGTHIITQKYQDESLYKEARTLYNGEANYKCDDATFSIIKTEYITTVGSGYSRPEDIDSYLLNNGFEERG